MCCRTAHALFAAALWFVFTWGRAPAATPAGHLTTTVTVASEYTTRGFRVSYGDPALQLTLNYDHPSGWFAGIFGTSTGGEFLEGGFAEFDFYGGYGGKFGSSDVHYKVALYEYYYPNARVEKLAVTPGTSTPYDFGEALVQVFWKELSLSGWYTFSKDFYGFNGDTLDGTKLHSRGSFYLDFDLVINLTKRLSFSGHLGRQWVKNFPDGNFIDFKFGFAEDLKKGRTLGIYTQGASFDGASVGRSYALYPPADVPNPFAPGTPTKNVVASIPVLYFSQTF
jgi:uncharacterized protein (TIGR02001 family)